MVPWKFILKQFEIDARGDRNIEVILSVFEALSRAVNPLPVKQCWNCLGDSKGRTPLAHWSNPQALINSNPLEWSPHSLAHC